VKSAAIGYALPLGSEIRWSDMLAALIATDPQPLCTLLALNVDDIDGLRVRREVAVDGANQPDLIIESNDRRLALIEVKVLAGLGPTQLDRYRAAVPDAEHYLVVYPQRLTIDLVGASPWQGFTWETLLGAYTGSTGTWVAATAGAWLEHLDVSLPKVDADTVWNGLVLGEDFVIAMRARMSWLHGRLAPPAPIRHDLVASTAGVSWVVRLLADAALPGYEVLVEVEENLPVRDFPKYADASWRQPRGPSIKVCLRQHGVETSAGFDWNYLHAMWPSMAAARTNWVTNPARPRAAHDRVGHQAMVAKGAPAYLGIGFGEAQTKISKACMFGARIQLPANVRLGAVAEELEGLYELVAEMASIVPAAEPAKP
jgi:hypothetical protein